MAFGLQRDVTAGPGPFDTRLLSAKAGSHLLQFLDLQAPDEQMDRRSSDTLAVERFLEHGLHDKKATREQLQFMMYRRFPSQTFANVQLIQSLTGARAKKNSPESKIQVCLTSQNSMPTLHRHCLNHLRLRLDA